MEERTLKKLREYKIFVEGLLSFERRALDGFKKPPKMMNKLG